MDWFYSRSCRGDNSNLCPKFVQNSEREMKMARGTSHRMWTFDEYVEEYEKLLAQLTKAEEEPKSLLAEKGMAGMGFVSKGAEKEIDSLRTQLAAHRWIPVGERLPEKQTLVRVRITIDGEPHIVRIRQMGEPHEWFNEYGQSTMSMKQIEENVIDWKELE